MRRLAAAVIAVVLVVGGCAAGERRSDTTAGAPGAPGRAPPAGQAPPAVPAVPPPAPPSPTGGADQAPPLLPDGEPGDLLAAGPIAPPPGVPAGARAWDVRYLSRSVAGEAVVVSGRVFAPAGPAPAGGFPVVTWGHGTTGAADHCAPSRLDQRPAWLGPLLEAGYVVAATDYEGLGTPGPHPYLVGESEGRSLLDAARAASRVEGVRTSGDVVVWGHSQGGHAALFAGSLAAEVAPELDVRGVVAAAPAAELAELLGAAGTSPLGLGFLATAVHAYAETYDDLEVTDVLTEAAAADLGLVEQRCIQGVVAAYLRPAAEVVARSPLDVPAWAARMAENTPTAPAGVPVLVLQGDRDPLVPAATTDHLVRRLCQDDATLRYLRYPGADHGSVLDAGRDPALRWMAARLDGEPPPSDC